jgi:predicted aconitase
MINKIELKLVDDKGNYSIAHIGYKGYIDMLAKHNVNMVVDVLDHMVLEYEQKGKMEIKFDIPNRIYSDTCSVVTYNEDNERMDIIGQNGNEGLHYVSNEEADEDARMSIQDLQHKLRVIDEEIKSKQNKIADAIMNHIQFQSPHKH